MKRSALAALKEKDSTPSEGLHAGAPIGPAAAADARRTLVAGGAYIMTSSSLILFNKHALSSFHFECPNCLLLGHCVLAVLLVKICQVRREKQCCYNVQLWSGAPNAQRKPRAVDANPLCCSASGYPSSTSSH